MSPFFSGFLCFFLDLFPPNLQQHDRLCKELGTDWRNMQLRAAAAALQMQNQERYTVVECVCVSILSQFEETHTFLLYFYFRGNRAHALP